MSPLKSVCSLLNTILCSGADVKKDFTDINVVNLFTMRNAKSLFFTPNNNPSVEVCAPPHMGIPSNLPYYAVLTPPAADTVTQYAILHSLCHNMQG